MTPTLTAPSLQQTQASTSIGGGSPQQQAAANSDVTAWAAAHNLAPELVSQFVLETGQGPGDNVFDWAKAKGYWNGQSGAGEAWTWHKVFNGANGMQKVTQGQTGVADQNGTYVIQPYGNTEDILRKMLTTPDYGLGTIQGNGAASGLAAGLNSGTLGSTVQQALQQAYGAQDWTKPDTANFSQSWAGQAPTDPGGALKNFIGDQLSQRMKWVNEGNNDENTTINQNLRSLSGQLFTGSGTAGGAKYGDASTQEKYLASLPDPNKIVARNFLQLDPDTQQFILGAYEQPDAAGNENGYSANDILNNVKNTLPKFQAPSLGSIRG